MSDNGFRIVKSTRMSEPLASKPISINDPNVTISDGPPILSSEPENGGNAGKLIDAVADNFSGILNIAQSIVDIKRIRVQTEAEVAMMEAKGKLLESQTRSYIDKIEAENKIVLSKAEIISRMLSDYYSEGTQSKMSSEDFTKVMLEVIDRWFPDDRRDG